MAYLTSLYFHIRYNFPLLYFLTVGFAVVVFVINLMSLTISAGLLDAIGATATGRRLVAVKEGVYWSYRAWRHSASDLQIKPERVYGYMVSTNRDGTINTQVLLNSEYQPLHVHLADLRITNPNGLAAVVDMYKTLPVDIDLYHIPGEQGSTASIPSAVIWFDARPFNIDLITASVATPVNTPPTDIVDRAFAKYNWDIAFGNR